jgi:hypothetical protein
MALSADALKLLRFFKERGLRLGDYAYPKDMEDVFGGDDAACERAQLELQEAGLLDLGSPLPPYQASCIRSATLTREGARYNDSSI